MDLPVDLIIHDNPTIGEPDVDVQFIRTEVWAFDDRKYRSIVGYEGRIPDSDIVLPASGASNREALEHSLLKGVIGNQVYPPLTQFLRNGSILGLGGRDIRSNSIVVFTDRHFLAKGIEDNIPEVFANQVCLGFIEHGDRFQGSVGLDGLLLADIQNDPPGIGKLSGNVHLNPFGYKIRRRRQTWNRVEDQIVRIGRIESRIGLRTIESRLGAEVRIRQVVPGSEPGRRLLRVARSVYELIEVCSCDLCITRKSCIGSGKISRAILETRGVGSVLTRQLKPVDPNRQLTLHQLHEKAVILGTAGRRCNFFTAQVLAPHQRREILRFTVVEG